MICERYENGVGVIYFHNNGQDTAEISQYMEDNGICILPVENREKQVAFLNSIFRGAVAEEMRAGIPWQVTLGQTALETEWGKNIPFDIYSNKDSNNIFGLKYVGEPSDNSDLFVRAWTYEHIDEENLYYWEKEHNRWALKGEAIENTGKRDDKGKLIIKLIQPFIVFPSKDECIIKHSEVLNNSDYYAEAEAYRDDPYKYLETIAPTYATDTEYYDKAKNIIDKYMDWEGKMIKTYKNIFYRDCYEDKGFFII